MMDLGAGLLRLVAFDNVTLSGFLFPVCFWGFYKNVTLSGFAFLCECRIVQCGVLRLIMSQFGALTSVLA